MRGNCEKVRKHLGSYTQVPFLWEVVNSEKKETPERKTEGSEGINT